MDGNLHLSRKILLAFSACFLAFGPALGTSSAHAFSDLWEALRESKVEGHLRLYNYTRWNDERTGVDNNALALGGDLRLQTGSLHGFSLGFGYYSANNIPIPDETVNEVLVGTHNNLNTLSEGYLQYQGHHILARGGRQLINTPWAREDMFTMIPRAFTGISAMAMPLMWFREKSSEETGASDHERYLYPKSVWEKYEEKLTAQPMDLTTTESLERPPTKQFPHLTLFGARMWRYQSRFKSYFTDGNRYVKEGTDGFVTFGAIFSERFGEDTLTAQGWFYDFYDFALLGYMESHYDWQLNSALKAVFALQFVIQGNSGDQVLGPVDAQVYGATAGFKFPKGSAYLVGNYSPVNYDSFRHGGMVHPYNDLSGTLYTDTMNDGISDIGPGYAYGVKFKYDLFEKSLSFYANYVRYLARYGFGGAAYPTDGPYGFPQGEPVRNQNQWAYGFGLDYRFSGKLEGLRIFDYIGVQDYQNSPRPFTDNRFGIVYAFSF